MFSTMIPSASGKPNNACSHPPARLERSRFASLARLFLDNVLAANSKGTSHQERVIRNESSGTSHRERVIEQIILTRQTERNAQ
jgi:hypothetical protein